MFGYVRPALNLLSEEDRENYKSAYCGLCHAMGHRHGWIARFTLNYDFTFLALLHYAGGSTCETECRRCPAHPLRGPKRCLCGNSLNQAADESMILTWYKLCDDVSDRNFAAGTPARLLRFLLHGAYRRAALAQPEFDQKVRDNMIQLARLEGERSPMLDRTADTFAQILTAAAGDCDGDRNKQRIMEQLLYHLGRWIYLIDAWDDLKDDRKKKRYNPLDARFDGKTEENREYIETTMTHSASLVAAACNLIDFGAWTDIIENVVFHSLPAIEKAVLDGRWKQMQRQGRKKHERSV